MLVLILMAVVCSCSADMQSTLVVPPKYYESKMVVDKVTKNLQEELKSIDKHIPFLDDSRRHFIELYHVIHMLAVSQAGSESAVYEDIYQKIINLYAPTAIYDPKSVLKTMDALSKNFKYRTELIENYIEVNCKNGNADLACDYSIQSAINQDPELKIQSNFLLIIGKASVTFENMHPKFVATCNAFKAHEYVIKGMVPLKQLVMDLAKVLKNLHPIV